MGTAEFCLGPAMDERRLGQYPQRCPLTAGGSTKRLPSLTTCVAASIVTFLRVSATSFLMSQDSFPTTVGPSLTSQALSDSAKESLKGTSQNTPRLSPRLSDFVKSSLEHIVDLHRLFPSGKNDHQLGAAT